MIQNFVHNGFTLTDIRELIALFQSSLDKYQEIFKDENHHNTLSALHKIKGGLRILQFSQLIADIDALENEIKLNGINSNQTHLTKFISDCLVTSNLLLSEIDNL